MRNLLLALAIFFVLFASYGCFPMMGGMMTGMGNDQRETYEKKTGENSGSTGGSSSHNH